MDLTTNEKKLLVALAPLDSAKPSYLAELLSVSEEAAIQYAYLLQDRGLAVVDRRVVKHYALTDEGRCYADCGLPERQLFDSFSHAIPLAELTRHPLAKIGIGQMRKKGWITIRDGMVEKTGKTAEEDDESALRNPVEGKKGVAELVKRGLLQEIEDVSYLISITDAGVAFARQGIEIQDETGTLTRDQIVSGSWRDLKLRRYTVEKIPRRVYPGKIHPYQRLIEEMRQILLQMGFTEIYGGIVQSAFWNFDALFQPQDHPAREMQDTFYLGERACLPPCFEKVRDMHLHGGATSSKGWGGTWSEEKASQCVLRTHSTSLTIRHLAEHPDPPVKAFSISRVYRREAIDPTHLPEFEQLEGIVMDEGVSFCNLLGFLKEFYNRMGFAGVRFRPGYFPYTEPSVEPEVYVPSLGWVEMGGAGIFREEVTAPFGLECPVLAWGLGVSRIAMLRLGLTDLRLLYRSDIAWVRDTPSLLPDQVPGGV
ncbi:MAG TPA: phenylalanine--tRNA ligase subunit alpha [Methanoregulaceae archaeon]|nr:MAG: phenylalanine--tRNA ligase subunit alpha [Methanolinea sp.]HON81065.1 phenylalanine--tRNA ligase subunit alpha [Methanoregulaceae archaeon]HPD10264.1 phenylalanine--tRNA ligase subunit alpha [Methanoregulaceae archaeon]HRT14651.1 phenylalanine--tRNA ligase subunit alpha [Methanoregulaceae archaeon]HRU30222.1 phenylalanine--tRNA ligase subunit alpha [Methanoregulaceae archaeon]